MKANMPIMHFTSDRGVQYPTCPVDVHCYFQGKPFCVPCDAYHREGDRRARGVRASEHPEPVAAHTYRGTP